MENKSISHSRPRLHLNTDYSLKPFTPIPRSKLLTVTASSMICPKSTNESPASIRPVLKSTISSSKFQRKRTVAYSDWEIYNACQVLKGQENRKNHSNLTRKLKNPHIYVNGTDIDSDAKLFEVHLFRAFKKIHDS